MAHHCCEVVAAAAQPPPPPGPRAAALQHPLWTVGGARGVGVMVRAGHAAAGSRGRAAALAAAAGELWASGAKG